jgi:hypothetical protein
MNLNDLKKLDLTATPGPWQEGQYGEPQPPHGWRKLITFETRFPGYSNPDHNEEYRANLLLMETLRTVCPDLIALVGALDEWRSYKDAHGDNGAGDLDRIAEAHDAFIQKLTAL